MSAVTKHNHSQHPAVTIKAPIDVSRFPLGERSDFYLPLSQNGLGEPSRIPFIVVRGAREGPTLGLTAVVHGNELNGIRIIHGLLANLRSSDLTGSIVCAPVVNVPSYLIGERRFLDDVDLNTCFPGKLNGTPSEQYAREFVAAFLPCCNYLIDIHTASEGRINSLYVRADIDSPETFAMAESFNPEIILNSKGGERTLRNAARVKNIPAITVEAGDPSVLQGKMVFEGEFGIRSVLTRLGMLKGLEKRTRIPLICQSSTWLRSTTGGILDTHFRLLERIDKKQLLAECIDPFGKVTKEYRSPSDGVVIGKATRPIAIPGTRFCHLGTLSASHQSKRSYL